jgi:hypothetical protein
MKDEQFVLAGFEFNDLWSPPVLYSHEQECVLITADEWEQAQVFRAMELADQKRQDLQANYDEYVWYIIRLNKKKQ